jgi:diaminopropionate ammonia-lyase
MGLRATLNPWREPALLTRPEGEPARAFLRALPGFAPTPLRALPGLARRLGVGALHLKDESTRLGLNAFKVLGAAWALERLRRSRPGLGTIACATEGNHGRAVAWAARQLGLAAVVFIPAGAHPERVARLRREGAEVELVPGRYDDAVRACAEQSAVRGWQVVSDTGYGGYLEIPGWIAEGYLTLFAEADAALAAAQAPAPTIVLVQAGVGGLLHAAVTHYRAAAGGPRIVAVEPDSADALITSIQGPAGAPAPATGRQDSIMAGLNCGAVSLSAWPAVRAGTDGFVTVSDPLAREAVRLLAEPEPGDPRVELSPTGAAGLAGLLALLREAGMQPVRKSLALDESSRILLVGTEGEVGNGSREQGGGMDES